VIQPTQALTALAQEHLQALRIGSEVTRWFRKDREPHVLEVTPERVLAALHEAGINPVLMGTHGLNGYREQARATQDVDVLVPKRQVRKAVRVLEQAFPCLEVSENAAVARLIDPVTQKAVIDVMKPSARVLQVVFRHAVPIGDTHRIPDLEMGLVSKFAAMVSPNRQRQRKVQDAADFVDIVMYHKDDVDLSKLCRLAEYVYPGGAAEIRRLVEDIWAGRDIRL
jgi:hypothetical protein